MATRFATRPGRPSINSSARHRARNVGDPPANGYQRRPRNEEGEEEEEPAPTPFPMWKTIAVVAVVIGCFAAVYPKMFHPMLLYALGYGQQQKTTEEEIFPHPSMKHSPGGKQPNFAGPHPQASRPSPQPHPGSRGGPVPGMGPGMNPMGGEGKAGGKSMWHWMLPFYTVGVIIFLLYTLSKILWKKPKKDPNRRRVNVRYNADRDRLETDEQEFDEDEYEEQQEEDEDGEVMSNKQLRGLQRRLQDTEQTMHDILSQLEQLSSTADPGAAEQIKKVTIETLNNLGKLNADRITPSKRHENGGFGPSNPAGNRHGEGLRFDATERRYLNDLQKALSDFKSFTENYIEEHAAKHPQEKGDEDGQEQAEGEMSGSKTEAESVEKNVKVGDEEETSIGDTQEKANVLERNVGVGGSSGIDEGDEIDIMESDKAMSSDQLKVEDGEGELTVVKNISDKVEDLTWAKALAGNSKGDVDEPKANTSRRHEMEEGEHGENEEDLQFEKKQRKHLRQRKGKRHPRVEE